MKNLVLPGRPSAARRALATRVLPAAALALGGGAYVLHPGRARAQPKGPVAPPLKVGFVYVSPVSDAGWTHQHDAGRRELERVLAPRVVTTFVEKVAEGPDAERVIRDLAVQGHRLIFTASFGFMDPTIRVAREFPGVAFEHGSGYKTAPNVGNYNARFYEGRYLAGLIAGRATRSNVLGYVAAFPIPEVLQGINAYAIGARAVNPQAEVRVVWTSSWFDPGRERDAAYTLANQGADVLTHHTDSSAVPQAAETRGVAVLGYHSDMSRAAPRTHLASVTHHWGRYYVQRSQAVLDGTWRAGSVWGGIRDGFVRIDAVSAALPTDVRALVAARTAEIAEGRLHPFSGPLADNAGTVRLARGPMADDDLNRMDWYVAGVAGTVPRR